MASLYPKFQRNGHGTYLCYACGIHHQRVSNCPDPVARAYAERDLGPDPAIKVEVAPPEEVA